MTAVDDQQRVQTFGAHASDEALRDGVRLWRANRCPHNPDAFIAEDPVGGPLYLLSRSRIEKRRRRTRDNSAPRASGPAPLPSRREAADQQCLGRELIGDPNLAVAEFVKKTAMTPARPMSMCRSPRRRSSAAGPGDRG